MKTATTRTTTTDEKEEVEVAITESSQDNKGEEQDISPETDGEGEGGESSCQETGDEEEGEQPISPDGEIDHEIETEDEDEEELDDNNKMNYFRSRFQRQQPSVMSTEMVLRDVRRRRSEILHNMELLDRAREEIKKKPSQDDNNTMMNQQQQMGTTSLRRRFRPQQQQQSNETVVDASYNLQAEPFSVVQRRRRLISVDRSPSIGAGERIGLPTTTSSSSIAIPKVESSRVVDDVAAAIGSSLSKSSSLRRRRHPSGGEGGKSSDDANPVKKKGNFTVTVTPATADCDREEKDPWQREKDISKETKKQDHIQAMEEEEKLLDAIEIKSAAQWKAMSQRISWKFDEESDQGEAKPEAVPPPPPTMSSSSNTSSSSSFKPTKAQQLRLICWKVKPWKQSKMNSRLFSSQYAKGWGVDCDEVYPGLFIGDKDSATNTQFLQKLGITHVLNTAEGKDEGLVDLSQAHYDGTGVKYLGFPLWDAPACNITSYLGCAAEFISDAVDNGGKCLVNCQMGVSRSATCAMAYLMMKKGMRAADVLTQLRQNRDVRPNDGFLEQIAALDNDLQGEKKMKLTTDMTMLPQAWNKEFWTKEMTEEEIGMPFVKLGEPCPLAPAATTCTRQQSVNSSRRSSAVLTRRSSTKGGGGSGSLSRRRSHRASKSISRRCSTTNCGDVNASKNDDEEGEEGQDWEWEWEEEEEEEDDVENREPNAATTTEKLEQVKDIIEKPEERWRILWQNVRSGVGEAPSPSSSSIRSVASSGKCSSCVSAAASSTNNPMRSNLIQAGPETEEDGGDPLSSVKVASARQWKAISRRLTINLDLIDLDNAEEEDDVQRRGAERLVRPSTPSDFKPTTVQQLRLICWKVKPWDQPRARHLFSSVLASGWGVDCDEVFPGLFVGDEAAARNIKFLQKLGITHVLNAAEGPWTDCSFVDLTPAFYDGSGITYQGFQLWDSSKVRILPYFGCFDEFISSAIGNGGKCLVHCQMGVSRSCTAAMVYMMLTQGWDAADAMREFRRRRDVRPNDHFLAQVAELDNELRKERLFGIPRTIRLFRLSDLHTLPRPWHHEFWDSEPDPETLPFRLRHMGEEDDDDMVKDSGVSVEVMTKKDTLDIPVVISDVAVRGKSPARSVTDASSEDDWEYYDDDEDDKDEKEVVAPEGQRAESGCSSSSLQVSEPPDERSRSCSSLSSFLEVDHIVGNAREWREISARLSDGSLQVREEVKEELEEEELMPSPDLGRRNRWSQEQRRATFEPTLEKHLRLVCWRVKPWLEKKKTSRLFSSQYAVLWNVDCDEVHPNLFIGDGAAARNVKFLQHLRITHVLNTAEGRDENLIDLSEDHYDGTGISYKGFLMWDSAWFDVRPFIEEAVEFIDGSLANGGRCLVNCQMGVSRSSTCALAYVMTKLGMGAVEALTKFRAHRDVRPNDGFIRFLVELDNRLRRRREGFE